MLGTLLVPDPPWLWGTTGLVHVVAALLVARAGHRRFGTLLAVLGAGYLVLAVLMAWVRTTLGPGPADGSATAVLWVVDALCATIGISSPVLLLAFPHGRFAPGRWGTASRVVTVFWLSSSALLVLGRVPLEVSPDPRDRLPADVAALDPTTVAAITPSVQPWLEAVLVLSFLGFLVPVLAVLVRLRTTSGLERDQVRWLVWGMAVVAMVTALAFLVGSGSWVDRVVTFVAVTMPPVVTSIALVAPRVVAIEDLLPRTLLFGGVSALLLGVDLVVISVLTGWLGARASERDVLLVVLVLSAVVYSPLRVRFAALVRRWVRGDRDHQYGAVSGLAAGLETAIGEDAQLAAVARAVATSFGVSYVSVEVDRADGERLAATRGTRPAETRVLPIRYRGETVGRLVLPARGLRTRLSRRDERLLGDLVRQAAAVARSSRLAEELQRNRERLVVAREEERRRIRHDLHDQLAPTLGGVVLQVDTATMLLDRDPAAAQQRIAETTDDLRAVVARVRRLVHDLRPPALDDLGLVEALRQHARTLPLPVGVAGDLAVTEELPAAVEVAVYRIAVDALDNVVRHAGAAAAAVLLLGPETGHRQVVLEVRDDGVGIPPEVEAGRGLVRLRERAAELGGRVEVLCPPEGGTVLRATIPVRAA